MCRPIAEELCRVGEQLAAAQRLLLCLDYDGTLTPIVAEPTQATLSKPMQLTLRHLAEPPRVSVAIISGRARADLQALVGLPGLIYAGNHGLEISGNGFIFIEPTAAAASQPLVDVAAELRDQLRHLDGVFVEDKGLTLSVHYRQTAAVDHEEVRRIVHDAAMKSDQWQLTTGKMVSEIRPRVNWNKGRAVSWIQERLGQAGMLIFYAGDDSTDEDVFAAHPDGITIKVGPESATAANYRIPGPDDLLGFLQWMEQLLRSSE